MRFRNFSANGKLVVTGKDRVRFLNGLFTNDVAALRPGTGCHAAMLNIKGKVVGDAIILCDEEALQLDLAPVLTDKVRDTMERHLIVDDVIIEDRTAMLDEVGVYGVDAEGALAAKFGDLSSLAPSSLSHVIRDGTRIVRVTDFGQAGFRLIVNAGNAMALAGDLVEQAAGGEISWLSDEEVEVMRVEAGVPRYGYDMGEDHLPIESRLDDAISHTKGCYMGQEVIARVTARGAVNRKLLGLRLAGVAPAERGARLSGPGRDDAGAVTSSVVSPQFGVIALGYVHKTVWNAGTELVVHENGGDRGATVVELPFPELHLRCRGRDGTLRDFKPPDTEIHKWDSETIAAHRKCGARRHRRS